ncbi:aldehyde dehydrogenase [Parvibaculum sp.]|uniref:aldehyde dehydrogenase n=1 Tax=Parvibaculum sp. TaxID=2024848 RepID=UPI003BA9004C
MQTYDRLFIGGEWVAPSSSETIDVISPATEEVIARVPAGKAADIDRAVAAARAAFDHGPWPRLTAAERVDWIRKLSAGLQARMSDIAVAVTTEMGCPITVSTMAQALPPGMVLDKYAEIASTHAFEQERAGLFGRVIVRQEPIGVCGLIVPWNFPLAIIAFKLGAALAAGCTTVVKPAPETPLDAYILAEVCEQIGFPKGVINVVVAGREDSELLVRHPDVDKISFTGNSVVGRRIASICGEQLKRCTLELGGKSAAIVLEDADPAMVVPGLVPNGILNTGQACAAQTRLLIPRSRYREYVDAIGDFLRAVPTGDPMDPTMQLGPLVAERQRERVLGYIEKGRAEGARLVVGGGRPAGLGKGWYVEPTLFADVKNEMTIAREEIFGPVLVAIPYDSQEDAIRISNESDYGLSGSVWTKDIERGIEIGRQVRTGTYNVNGFIIDFGSPFGGYKASGIGREFGPEGIACFSEYKSIAIF